MSPKTISTSILALLAAGGLAACGSSKAPGVQPVPSGGATEAAATAAPTTSTASTPTASTPTATTPKPPSPLSKKPVVSVPSGPPPTKLQVKDLVTGTGPTAKAGSQLTVNYVGVLYKDGKEFDSSWKRNQPFPFQLGQGAVIKGWDQGLVGMKVGGRRELIIPSDLAYGKTGSPPTIPPDSALVFVVDLLGAS
jgi:FKBP-type peptidyl-prolyl cis-trans isomerase